MQSIPCISPVGEETKCLQHQKWSVENQGVSGRKVSAASVARPCPTTLHHECHAVDFIREFQAKARQTKSLKD